MDQINELERLAKLKDQGILNDIEFQEQKSKILNPASPKSTDIIGNLSGKKISPKVRRTFVVTVGLIIIVTLVYKFFFSQSQKDSVNTIASVVGVAKIVPWVDRAQTSARTTTERSKDAIASTIVGTLHPTAVAPTLESYQVEIHGDIVEERFKCNFRGGFMGGHYHLELKWRFSEQLNFGISVVSDDAITGIDPAQIKKLETYFQTEVYPVLLGNAH